MRFVAMKKAYLIDFIGFMIAKAKNISHLFSMAYVDSGNRCGFTVQQGAVCWTHLRQGKITRTPKIPPQAREAILQGAPQQTSVDSSPTSCPARCTALGQALPGLPSSVAEWSTDSCG